jgi:predicted dehydrogenase
MLRIGIAGVGFMGMMHFQAVKRIPGARVTAIATRDPKKRSGDWTGIQGNFGPRGQKEDLSGVAVFDSADALAREADVDLVDVCLPSNDHVATTLAALESGRHVLVEKPIALRLEDADRMVAKAKEAERLLLVAHVLPFFADFRFAREAVFSGRFGRLRAAHFRRHIAPPAWSDAMADLTRVGGPLIDLHIHDNHFIVATCGRPIGVQSRGIVENGVVNYVATQYLYDGDLQVTATSGSLSPASRPFTHGYELYFERGLLHYEAGSPLKVYTGDGVETPTLAGGDEIDSFKDEISAALEAIQLGQPSPILDGGMARDALALCLKEEESVKTGRVVSLG